jgi:DNA-binding CsgD family transcriptional regulator
LVGLFRSTRNPELIKKPQAETLKKAGDSFDQLPVIDIMYPSGKITKSGDEVRGDNPIHGSKNGGNYVVNTRKNAWHCKRCDSGGGAALAIAVKEGIISCADAQEGVLRGDLFKQVLRIAEQKYGLKPINSSNKSKAEEKSPKDDPDLEAKALAISTKGDPFKYLLWQAQRNHIGDMEYQKVLICSIGSAASETSHGIQPGGTGDKGSGKSDACASTYILIPSDRKIDCSLSPMGLFYMQTEGSLKTGMILWSDDVEYEPIIPIYKRATGSFQKEMIHRTVSGGKTREGITLKVPPRLVWWLTSVESVANEQAFDRQYPCSTDSSLAHKKMVSKEIRMRRTRKELRLIEDEGIKIAQYIIADIFDNGPFRVLIPQAENARWLKDSDFRGQDQFWDLVDALAILHWRQRKMDPDGWLIAADEDLLVAKDILTAHKTARFSSLTEAEVQLVGHLMDGIPHTQKELCERLGIAQSTVAERLNSIMHKSPIITEDRYGGSKVYSVNPKTNIGTDYWNNVELINIGIDNEETYRSQQIALSVCYRNVIGLPIGITINNSIHIPISYRSDLGESGKNPISERENKSNSLSFSPSSELKTPITIAGDQMAHQYHTDKVPITLCSEGDNVYTPPDGEKLKNESTDKADKFKFDVQNNNETFTIEVTPPKPILTESPNRNQKLAQEIATAKAELQAWSKFKEEAVTT